jgi:hypothetical protein
MVRNLPGSDVVHTAARKVRLTADLGAVDYCVCVLPLLIIAAAIPAAIGGRYRKAWRWVAGGLLALFLMIYFVPGGVLWVFAQGGNREAR